MKNSTFKLNLRKTVISSALAAIIPVSSAVADIYVWGSITGPVTDPATCTNSPDAARVIFTLVNPVGQITTNADSAGAIDIVGAQTPTCGTITFDTKTQTGSAEIVSFSFFGSGPADAQAITIDALQSPQDLGIGNLFLGNMLFNWNGNIGIPVSLAWDATGLLNEMDGTPTSYTLGADGTILTAVDYSQGALPVTDGSDVLGGAFLVFNTGPSPLAMRAENTVNVNLNADECKPGADGDYSNNIGGGCMGIVPSADKSALLLVDSTENSLKTTPNTEGLGGNPMVDGPFTGNNANFDFNTVKLVSFTDTTAPAVPVLNAHVSPAGTSVINLIDGVNTYTEPGAVCTDAPPLNTVIPVAAPTGVPTSDPNTLTLGQSTVLTYTCTDASGNTSTVDRTVNVVGPNAVITLNANTNGEVSPVTQECGLAYIDAGAVCFDDPDGNIPVGGNGTPPSDFALDITGVNTSAKGLYNASWTCTDTAGNTNTVLRGVNVVDTTGPVITPNAASNPEVIVSSTPDVPAAYIDLGAQATDSCDPGFPVNIPQASSGVVTMTVPDDQNFIVSNLQYTATDIDGNQTTAVLTVNVMRSQPVITLVGGGVVLNIGEAYVEPGMDVADLQDTSVTGVVSSGLCGGMTCTIDSSTVDVNTAGSYTVTYDVVDSDTNKATQLTRTVQVGVFATGSNFTMLNSGGSVIGGTNDVVFDWDKTTNNDQVDYTNNLNFNMSISSQQPFPFFGFVWEAHTIRVFGPGTYSFDTGCTVVEIQTTGCPANSANNSGPTLTMTVPPGYVGAHILFDWNTTSDIDVVNVWDNSGAGVWDRHGGTGDVNKLYDGLAGSPPDPSTTWKLVSTDIDGDGINASPMVDGPFQGFNANFNAGPAGTAAPTPPYTGSAPDTKLGGGVLASFSILGLFAGLLTLFGLRRFSKNQ